MDMVGHQHIAMEPAVIFATGVGQFFQVKPVIVLSEEHILTVIAALDDVLGLPGQDETG
jgi:hypothetical protein